MERKIKSLISSSLCNLKFILTIIFVTTFLMYELSTLSIFKFSGVNNYKKTEDKMISNCNPINIDYIQYTVKIDGFKYPTSLPLYKNRSINFECLNKSKKVKTILAWNSFFGDYSYSSPFEGIQCPVKNCLFTSDKKLLNHSDLVIVHMRDSIDDPPKFRPKFQRWVFLLYESPIHSGNFNKYNKIFNLTSTYKIESDFPGFYESSSSMIWKNNAFFNDSYDFFSNKSKFATAVISNCGASSRRLEYIKEMQKYIELDVYGRCGKKCPNKYSDSSPGECKDILGKEYKFYFAFENSICQEYITEKFFLILKYNIIPVVMGGGGYEFFVSNILE